MEGKLRDAAAAVRRGGLREAAAQEATLKRLCVAVRLANLPA